MARTKSKSKSSTTTTTTTKTTTLSTPPRLGTVLVCGGAGWLGSHLVEALLRLGSDQVQHIHIIDVVPSTLSSTRITSHVIDLRDAQAVRHVVLDNQPQVIFHLASVVDVRPIKSQAVMDINVGGSVNLLLAATACAATKAFVYCSTLDVVYTGRPMDFVQETLPYTKAENFRWWVPGNYYAPSKARAEECILSANSEMSGALKTCALRPGHLFGERDAILDFFTRLPVSMSTQGQMTMQYIGNTAALHILAARELLSENPTVCGEAFNIGDQDISFSEFYGRVLQPTHAGHQPPWLLPLPIFLLFLIGLSMDVVDFCLWILGQLLTPFLMCCRIKKRGDHCKLRFPRHPALCLCSASALESSEHHRTNLSKGHRVFGYDQKYGTTTLDHVTFVSWKESIERTRQWMQDKMVHHPKHRTTGYSFQG